MAYYKDILDEQTRNEFERPPLLDYQLRKHFFAVPAWLEELLDELSTDINRAGFLLQLGYFQATGRFFKATAFRKADVLYISQRKLRLPESIDLTLYPYSTLQRHQQQILKALGVMPFEGAARELCQQEAFQLVKQLIKPALVFGALAHFIRTHRIQVPAYTVMTALINKAVEALDEQLDSQLQHQLTPAMVTALDGLLQKTTTNPALSKTKPYRLTSLKNTQEQIRNKTIQVNISSLLVFKALYRLLEPVLLALQLSEPLIELYAHYICRSQAYHIKEWKNKYLLLIGFVSYQYRYLNDVLLDTFMVVIAQNINYCERAYKQERLEKYEQNLSQFQTILAHYQQGALQIQAMQKLLFDLASTQPDKLAGLSDLLQQEATERFLKLLPIVTELNQQTTRKINQEDVYQHITDGSLQAQGKVSDIVRHVDWQSDRSGQDLLSALLFFQQKDGLLTQHTPLTFLKEDDRKAVRDEGGKLKPSLYKALLFRYLLKALKTGSIYVDLSHTYRSIDTYQIPRQEWNQFRQTFLERANLERFAYWPTLQDDLQKALKDQIEKTIGRITSGENLFVEKRKNMTLRFKVPTKVAPDVESIPDFYPTNRLVTLYEALTTVNEVCHFLDEFKPFKDRPRSPRPPDELFIAGLMAFGCNLGLSRVAKASQQISQARLETTVNNYFLLENVTRANDCINGFIEKLGLGKLFKQHPDLTHTSSDGQKYTLSVESIHANYAYKYFGKDKGVTLYNFVTDNHNVFFSTVFSTKDQEAWYVLDGLMHNEIIETDQHSTDTHGATPSIFALCHLMGIQFQPRLKQFHKLTLHGVGDAVFSAQEDFILKIGKPIDAELIANNWDNILRLSASILLKYTKPSLVMKRLNSYALQNPLYQGLNELGRLIRSQYLLEYMDDEDIRQRTDQQLNKIESIHTLARAIFYGNNGVIEYANLDELYLIESCKRLLINVVICWNYLYLTKYIVQSPPNERQRLADSIPFISTVAWKHFNFQGEFNFDENLPRDQMETYLAELLTYQPVVSKFDV